LDACPRKEGKRKKKRSVQEVRKNAGKGGENAGLALPGTNKGEDPNDPKERNVRTSEGKRSSIPNRSRKAMKTYFTGGKKKKEGG